MPSVSRAVTSSRKRSTCSTRHPLGYMTVQLGFRPLGMLVCRDAPNQITEEGPAAQGHRQALTRSFGPQQRRHLVAQDLVGEFPRLLPLRVVFGNYDVHRRASLPTHVPIW